MSVLEPHQHGVLLTVKAQAGARRNAIRGVQDGMLQVSVTQAPEKGKANRAIVAVLASALKLRNSQLELVSGETSPRKKFLVRDVTIEELNAQIAATLAAQG